MSVFNVTSEYNYSNKKMRYNERVSKYQDFIKDEKSSIFGNTPIFIKKNDVTPNFEANYKENPKAVMYGPVKIDENVIYTDCFEISLLRFLHVVFGKNGNINIKRMKKLMNNEKNQLYCYFQKNNIYYNDNKYYSTLEGFNERTNWCNFLNEIKIFNYKKEDRYEVCASLDNLFLFFNHFFHFNLDTNDSDQHNLNIIGKKLSSINKQIRFDLSIFGEYNSEDFYINTYTKIYVNDDHLYDWEIYQYYNVNNYNITKRLTGHSDFKESTHVRNL